MQALGVFLDTLEACCKSRLHRLAVGLNLLALLSKPLELLVTVVQLLKQRLDRLFVHAEPDPLSNFIFVVALLRVRGEYSFEVVS